jgi:cystinosin
MTSDSSVRFLKALSRVCGWTYTFAWSASFYPQPLLNAKRRSVQGMGIDFPILNVFGFLCYSISTTALLYSPLIRSQYAARHPVSLEPTVRFNDLVFGLHAVVLTALTYSQFFPKLWGFEVSKSHRIARPVAGVFWGCICAVLIVILIVLIKGQARHYDPLAWAWIDVVSEIGRLQAWSLIETDIHPWVCQSSRHLC